MAWQRTAICGLLLASTGVVPACDTEPSSVEDISLACINGSGGYRMSEDGEPARCEGLWYDRYQDRYSAALDALLQQAGADDKALIIGR